MDSFQAQSVQHNPSSQSLPANPPQGIISRFKQLVTKGHPTPNHTGQSLKLRVAQRTDVGRTRQHNEDNVAYIVPKDEHLLAAKGALFIVADGMGGHAAGEVASEIAVDTVCTLYYQNPELDVAENLRADIEYANSVIYEHATENASHSGMGTTCVVAVLLGSTAYVANVGDSRAYHLHHGQLRQITQDHSWVAEQVRLGNLSPEQARVHAMRNVITRSLGPYPDVDVDVFVVPVEHGDALVLCSDGLSGLVNDVDLLRIVESFDPQESVYHLVEKANAQGGIDNISAIVVRVTNR
jgi:PPM family protein phosphatase